MESESSHQPANEQQVDSDTSKSQEKALSDKDNDAPDEVRTVENNANPAPASKGKRTRRILLLVSFLLLVAGAGWVVLNILQPTKSSPRINPLNLVPADAFFIIETNQPYSAWNKIAGTQLWKTLAEDEDWKAYGTQLDEIEQKLSSFGQVLDLLDQRTIYVSGHLYHRDSYDYLFVLDMNGLAAIRTWLKSSGNLTKRTFKGTTIFEQLDPASKETLFFSFIDNFFVGSYTHALVEKSIMEYEEAHLARSFDFIEVKKETIGEGVARLFLNYATLYPYLEQTIGGEYTQVIRENLPLFHSGFFFDVDESTLLLQGYSNYNDSLSTYLKLFKDAGMGSLKIAEVLPTETAIYLSLGFDSFQSFYGALDDQLKQDPLYAEEYELYTKRTEKFLNIDIEEDFVSWIDDEVAVAQIAKDKEADLALILKAKSKGKASEKMTFLSKQIKKRTPVKFKQIEYKGYSINFMSVKGFFNLVLGQLFSYFDRPYYAIIDEYVVFSNKPSTLKVIIDSYASKSTLANSISYKGFIKQLKEQHSALIYLQLPLLIESEGGMIDNETTQLLKEKQHLVERFPQLAFSLYPSKNMFQTRALISLNKVIQPSRVELAPGAAELDTINYDSIFMAMPEEQIAIEAIEIELEDLGAKNQTEAYEDGATKYELSIKNGQKHGNYFEYHPTGELKIKGKYKKDQKEGVWKYYDDNGELVKKEKYKKGKLSEH